ncbi:MAG: LytTR family transcriptional regulator [Saprospiraceae bacterium]|nr:LytTR family transcriptional regulator [Saprospiraceae bacterium]
MSTITRKLSTEVGFSSMQKLSIATFWLGLALLSTLSAVLYGMHENMDMSPYRIFDLSFFYFTPAFLWILLTPWICRLADRYPLRPKSWRKAFGHHLLLAIVLAPFTRFGALFLDFSIKYFLGMTTQSPFTIVADVYLVGLASVPRDVFNYWLVIGVYTLWTYKWPRLAEQQTHLSIRQGHQYIKLATTDIYWVQAAGNYALIFTKDRSYRTRQTLKQLEKELAPLGFERVHRSFLVNIHQVESLSHWRSGEYLIQMKNNKRLTSSRTYLPNVKKLKVVKF